MEPNLNTSDLLHVHTQPYTHIQPPPPPRGSSSSAYGAAGAGAGAAGAGAAGANGGGGGGNKAVETARFLKTFHGNAAVISRRIYETSQRLSHLSRRAFVCCVCVVGGVCGRMT